jgi:hypothetical protein
VEVINSGRARDKFLLQCLRELTFIAASLEFEIRARHLPGVTNRLPDLLSRWDLRGNVQSQFASLTKGIDTFEFTVCEDLFRFSHDW